MKSKKANFSFKSIHEQYEKAIGLGYNFMTCIDYASHSKNNLGLTIVNRVDVDFSIKKADKLLSIFNSLKIKATFFIRLHAPEYNPFSFENYRIVKKIIDSGHEIGYHSEIIDQASIWDEAPDFCLRRDLDVLNQIFNIKIKGIASHGGMTGLNNLDFWKTRNVNEFNIDYEAYEENGKFNLFNNSFYISDSEWIRWKSYNNGVLNLNDTRSFGEHLNDNHKLIYLLIHPDTYYDNNIYE
jgi:hypothetical protein